MYPDSQARVVWSGGQGMTDAILNERFTKKRTPRSFATAGLDGRT